MSDPGFVHLGVHSEYSLIDSTVRIKRLVERTAELGMPAVALTDQSNLFGLVKFYRAAERAGIKPIVGADIWVDNPEDPRLPHRMTLLCQDRAGYLSLCRLLSRGFQSRAGRDRAVIARDWIQQQNRGLIALSGQRTGEIGQLLLEGKPNRAEAALKRWMQVFDQDRFYVDVARTGRDRESSYLGAALTLAHDAGCPALASNDVRFLHAAEFDAHEARVCIQHGRVLNDPKRPRDYTNQQYLRGPQEMAECFTDCPELLSNTVELAKRLNLELELGKPYLPNFPVPEDRSVETHLKSEATEGLNSRLNPRRDQK